MAAPAPGPRSGPANVLGPGPSGFVTLGPASIVNISHASAPSPNNRSVLSSPTGLSPSPPLALAPISSPPVTATPSASPPVSSPPPPSTPAPSAPPPSAPPPTSSPPPPPTAPAPSSPPPGGPPPPVTPAPAATSPPPPGTPAPVPSSPPPPSTPAPVPSSPPPAVTPAPAASSPPPPVLAPPPATPPTSSPPPPPAIVITPSPAVTPSPPPPVIASPPPPIAPAPLASSPPPPPGAPAPTASSPPPTGAPAPAVIIFSPPPTFSPPPPVFSPPPPLSSSPPPPLVASPPPPPSHSSGGGLGTGAIAGIAAGGAAAVIVGGLILLWCCFWKPRQDPRRLEEGGASGPKGNGYATAAPTGYPTSKFGGSGPGSGPGPTSGLTQGSGGLTPVGAPISPFSSHPNTDSWFSYEELSTATQGFSEANKLGEGGFGKVYKGVLHDGREIAVKVLTVGGGQGEREFRAEVEIISRVHHRHLVTLLGYCIANEQRLLVYEYVPNGALEHALHGRRGAPMDWALRMKVAVGAAKGLAYLHEDCHPRIFHRDIKSSNILIDAQYEAEVADFGLAKLASDTFTHVTTRVMGTFGYLAPEYAMSGKLTDKSDVYSFGVVLLELITGRKPVDTSQPPGQESLVEYARPLLGASDYTQVVDPALEDNYVPQQMQRMVEAAALCVRHSAARRPKMSQVVRLLEGTSDVSEIQSTSNKPGISQQYDAFGGSEDYDPDEYSQEMKMQYRGGGRPPVEPQSGAVPFPSGTSNMDYVDYGASSNNSSGEYLSGASRGGRSGAGGSGQRRPPVYSGWSGSTNSNSGQQPGGSGSVPSEEFNGRSGPLPKFSGELDYGQGNAAKMSDRLNEGR